jgi:hypothetical protein
VILRGDVLVRGDEAAEASLRDLARNATDSRRFLRKAAAVLMRKSRERWDRNGYGWKPLDRDTLRRKAKRGQSSRPLRATGLLSKALTQWKAPGQRLDFGPDLLVFGLKRTGVAFYGRFHQGGDGVPRRRVLAMTRATREELRQALLDHLLPGRRPHG